MNLAWTKSKRQKLAKYLHARFNLYKHKKRGIEMMYFRLTKTTGVKVSRTPRSLNVVKRAMKRQKRAHELGYAPCVGEIVQVTVPNLGTCYGYVTEHVPRLRVSSAQLNELEGVLRKMGLSVGDVDVDHNVGMLRGRPVLIDFGDMST